MISNRKTISNALLTLLGGAYAFDKKIRHAENVFNQDTLTLMLFSDQETWTPQKGAGLSSYEINFICIVTGRASDEAGTEADNAMDKIDDILDGIDRTLHPVAGWTQTLAAQNNNVPLVTDVYVDGTVLIDPPVERTQWAIWMSIKVLVGM